MTNIFFGRLNKFYDKYDLSCSEIDEFKHYFKLNLNNDWFNEDFNIKCYMDEYVMHKGIEKGQHFVLIKTVETEYEQKIEMEYELLAYLKVSDYSSNKYKFIELCSRLTDNEDEDNLLELISRYHDKYKTKLLPGYMYYDDNIDFWHGYIKHQINNKDISLKEFMINNKINQYVTEWKYVFDDEQFTMTIN